MALGFQFPQGFQAATELVLPAWALKTKMRANHFGYPGSRTELILFQKLTCILDGFRLGQGGLICDCTLKQSSVDYADKVVQS